MSEQHIHIREYYKLVILVLTSLYNMTRCDLALGLFSLGFVPSLALTLRDPQQLPNHIAV